MDERFEIFYIRHAEPASKCFEDRDTCDVRLCEHGEMQARLLGERFKNYKFDAVFSSPLVRCLKTAEGATSLMPERPCIEVMPELCECGSTPGYTGCDMETLLKFYPSLKYCEDRLYDGEIPYATDEQNDERARRVLSYFKNRFTFGQRIAVFCHGSFANHFLWAVIGAEPVENMIFSINHASVTKIKITPDGDTRISFMNDVSHLRCDMPDFDLTV